MKNFQRFQTLPAQAKKKVLVRYTLFQIPDLVILLLALLILQMWVEVPSWLGLGLVVLWILKDIALFPFVWRAYEGSSPDERQALIGAEGVAEKELKPAGYIRVHGDLWQARLTEEERVVQKGEKVVVNGVDGLVLKVCPKEERGKAEVKHVRQAH